MMSDEPDTQGDHGGGQSGQKQDTPRSGQGGQQTGQPSSAPQDGQPPTQQDGQPRGGQTPGRPANGQNGSGGVDISPVLQEWAKFVTLLFAIGGAGAGLVLLLFDAIDEPLLQASGTGMGGVGSALTSSMAVLIVGGLVPTMLAVFIGVYLYEQLRTTDEDPLKVAAAAVGLGVFVAFLLVSILGTITLDGVSIAFGGVIINGIISALVAAGAAAGGVWAMQNQAP
jgi:hypothetical protein